MSAIDVGGRRYAAGLYWLGRGGPGATVRAARRLGRPWFVHRGERTGFAVDDVADSPEGLPALALALLDLINGEFWMALVEGDAADGEADDEMSRFALVKARDGAVLADGDVVFDDPRGGFGRLRACPLAGVDAPRHARPHRRPRCLRFRDRGA